ncbi:DoxX family protein [Candidatus Campbellbacteria bacterium]|nr:MAG: DoxX family protein [Candidatus Campbellbacteria bacterium]
MKKAKVAFWISTTIIFLFEGVMPALTSQSQMSIDGITHLGYPIYFITLLTVFKVLGSLALMIPKVPARVKEWAYAGFGFDFIFAGLSIIAVDGFGAPVLFPLIALGVLAISYTNYHKLQQSV